MMAGLLEISAGKLGAASPNLGKSCTGTLVAGKIEYRSSIVGYERGSKRDISCRDG